MRTHVTNFDEIKYMFSVTIICLLIIIFTNLPDQQQARVDLLEAHTGGSHSYNLLF